MSDEKIREAIRAVQAALRGPPVCPLCGSATHEQYHPPDGGDPECWTYHCTDEAQVGGGGCGYEWGLGGEIDAPQRVEDGIPAVLRSAISSLVSAYQPPLPVAPQASALAAATNRACRAGWTPSGTGGWRGIGGVLVLAFDGRTLYWVHLHTGLRYQRESAALTAALDYAGVPR